MKILFLLFEMKCEGGDGVLFDFDWFVFFFLWL